MGTDTRWFKHDTNAHSDPAIRRLIYEYGITSYGIWWVMVELMASRKDLRLELDSLTETISTLVQGEILQEENEDGVYITTYLDAKGNTRYEREAGRLTIGAGELQGMLESYLKVGLLHLEEESKVTFVYSQSLRDRMHSYDEIKEKQREGGKKGGLKSAQIRQQNQGVISPKVTSRLPQGDLKVNSKVTSTDLTILDSTILDKNIIHTRKPKVAADTVSRTAYGENKLVLLSDEEYSKLLAKHSSKLKAGIQLLDDWVNNNPGGLSWFSKKYRSAFTYLNPTSCWVWEKVENCKCMGPGQQRKPFVSKAQAVQDMLDEEIRKGLKKDYPDLELFHGDVIDISEVEQ